MENLKENVQISFASKTVNLTNLPTQKWQNLDIVMFNKKDGRIITDNDLENEGISKEELFEIAKENSRQEWVLISLMQMMKNTFLKLKDEDMCCCPLDDLSNIDKTEDMFALTNRENSMGAIAILYEDNLRKIAEELNSNLIIFPSSIHEVMIHPVGNKTDIDFVFDMNNVVKEVNNNDIQPSIQMSDNCYLYDRENNKIIYVA